MNKKTLCKIFFLKLSSFALITNLLVTPVFSDQITTVIYSVEPNYTVVIPPTLMITDKDTLVGEENNVFIRSDSRIGNTETITVSLAVQNFEAKNLNSTMPFTVEYTRQIGAMKDASSTSIIKVEKAIPILVQTGARISAIIDINEATTGAEGISASVKAKATAEQVAMAGTAGTHIGTINFTVIKT
ncbi:MAG: hypothetical protein LBF59_03790 [Prevotellaceae bacterium]|jgi:hypothetical protein|nr:hypothetical protein [Prevotellaceae bacterium]